MCHQLNVIGMAKGGPVSPEDEVGLITRTSSRWIEGGGALISSTGMHTCGVAFRKGFVK